jgi:hypothetical protein
MKTFYGILICLITISLSFSQTLQFTRITEGYIVNDEGTSVGIGWGNLNNDAADLLDLFVSNYHQTNNLYINEDGYNFVPISDAYIVDEDKRTNGGSFGDFDNDGDLDIFIGHSTSNQSEYRNEIYINNGDGTFEPMTEGEVVNEGNSWSGTWVDYDND